MNGLFRRMSAITAAAALVVVGVGISQPTQAMAASSATTYSLYAPKSAQSVPLEAPQMSTRSIGAHHNDFCKLNPGNPDYVLRNYQNVAGPAYKAGTTALKCGTSKTGWLHIQQGHTKSWSNIMAGLDAGDDWGNVADFATNQALNYRWGSVGQENGKTCFFTPIQIRDDESGAIIRAFWVNTVVSQANRHIITSFPSTVNSGCTPTS